ncbi:MAG TPA: hypothetical protein VF742_10970 [Terracidiphilus sp.]
MPSFLRKAISKAESVRAPWFPTPFQTNSRPAFRIGRDQRRLVQGFDVSRDDVLLFITT